MESAGESIPRPHRPYAAAAPCNAPGMTAAIRLGMLTPSSNTTLELVSTPLVATMRAEAGIPILDSIAPGLEKPETRLDRSGGSPRPRVWPLTMPAMRASQRTKLVDAKR